MDHYDIDGAPVTLQEWDRLLADLSYRRVGFDKIGRFTVSTVWLGLNYNFFGDGTPEIFETMVFEEGKPAAEPDHMERYSTKEQAIAGHSLTVLTYKALVQDENK